MVKLLIATTNPGKFEEAKDVFDPSNDGIEILSLRDFPGIEPVPENGKSFEENAVLKAKGYYEKTGVPTIADDGGLMVDYLNGLPGVNSHRWLGHEASDEELARAVVEKLQGVPLEKRTARLGGFIAFWDGEHLLKSESWLEGYIAEKISGEIKPGLPYRSILVIPQFQKLYSDLTTDEHYEVSFRRKNLLELKSKILSALGARLPPAYRQGRDGQGPASGWEYSEGSDKL